MSLTPIGGGWVYDSVANSMVYDPAADTTTSSGAPAVGSATLSWTSTTKPPRTSSGSGGSSRHPPTVQGELDVPGKTSNWNHRHSTRSSLRAAPAHRKPH